MLPNDMRYPNSNKKRTKKVTGYGRKHIHSYAFFKKLFLCTKKRPYFFLRDRKNFFFLSFAIEVSSVCYEMIKKREGTKISALRTVPNPA